MKIVERIIASVSLPVTLDFEGGYSEVDEQLAENISQIIDLGVIGINFEDRVVKGVGLYPVERQAERMATIRNAAEKKELSSLSMLALTCSWVRRAIQLR